MKTPAKIQICGKTDVGLKRSRNEDCYLIIDRPEKKCDTRFLGILLALADGMGGHPAGDIASSLACKKFKKYYYNVSPLKKTLFALTDTFVLNHMKRAIEKTQEEISSYESDHQNCFGFGTTFSALVLLNHKAFIVHVGDSRIYRLRGNGLKQLTVDHTFVQEMVDMGELRPDEARQSPYRHVLTQALGVGYEKVYLAKEDVRPGDSFLLCSDGLHDLVSDREIMKIMQKEDENKEVCNQLIEAAIKKGGRDNITVIVAKVL